MRANMCPIDHPCGGVLREYHVLSTHVVLHCLNGHSHIIGTPSPLRAAPVVMVSPRGRNKQPMRAKRCQRCELVMQPEGRPMAWANRRYCRPCARLVNCANALKAKRKYRAKVAVSA